MAKKHLIILVSVFAVPLVLPAYAGTSLPLRKQGQESRQAESQVKMWQEEIVIPTYRLNPADENPMFYTHESYQGAEKRIYPYPLLDGVTNIKEPKTYKTLYLENEYIRLSILPEIGGRLFSALDKTNNYEIFYHQHVIKPAPVSYTHLTLPTILRV